MKKARLILTAIAVAFALAFTLAPIAPTYASTADDLRAADESLSTSVEKFMRDVQGAADSEDAGAVAAAFASLQETAAKAKAEFKRITDEAQSDGWQKIADKMTAAVDKLSSSAGALKAALDTEDATAYNTAATEFSNAANDYQKAIDEANEYMVNNPLDSGDTSYAFWTVLTVVSVACLAAAIVVNIVTRNQQGTATIGKQEMSLKGVRRNILIGAAIFVASAAIPTVQIYYVMHQAGGGNYYFSWYWPVVGAVLFVAGAVQYAIVYSKVKKADTLTHADNATEVAKAAASAASQKTKK
ncbi:MAG: hypothetical protein LBG75_00990 [Candidatus Nomurabacteria bacterium]|jgi:membrane-associated HD superfamily phosphohydrolase|nr:hypothetical protein [Candidatus Nomurabacteria bacterium]